MNTLPKISVIVAVYNVEKYIEKCVRSILEQRYDNIEIVLVNDGSGDRSGEICDQLREIDSRIKVLHKKNEGAAMARNVGLNHISGDYVGFVDSDDFIDNEMYSILMSNLLKTDSDISVCSYIKVYDNGSTQVESYDNKLTVLNADQAMGAFYTFDSSNMNVPWNKLYKRTLFDGIEFPRGNVRDDESTIYKLVYRSTRIVVTQKVLYYYFQNTNSVLHVKSLKKEIDYADAMQGRLDFFIKVKDKKYYDITLKRYCIWLSAFYFMHRGLKDKEKQVFRDMDRRKSEYVELLLSKKELSKIATFMFSISRKRSLLISFLAYHKLYRFNFVSKLAGVLFDDKGSLRNTHLN
jgi:glycosyltransferase involved in cell wall biosynthesis